MKKYYQLYLLKRQNKNFKSSKLEILRLLWDIIFRLVAYLLYMICLSLLHLNKVVLIYVYDFSYNFDIVLYQFLETGTSDRCLIGTVQNLRFLGFSLYPLSVFHYSPFKETICKNKKVIEI